MAKTKTIFIKEFIVKICFLLSFFFDYYYYMLNFFNLESNFNNQKLIIKRDSSKIHFNKNKSCGAQEKYLSHYLAGLIEGDGYISITNENRILLGITFNLKDKPLAEYLLHYLGKGTIVKRKTNSVELRFSAKKTIIKIVDLINGKFRTPKIDQLYKLIDWMNKNYSTKINKLPLDDSPINLNSWLSGFIDADGNFYIRFSEKQIICKFALEQRIIYPKTNESYDFILNYICLYFNIKLHTRIKKMPAQSEAFKSYFKPFGFIRKNSYYIIKIENQQSIKLLINYLKDYPLLSSKYLDFLSWDKAFKEIINKTHFTIEGRKIILEQKNQMNNKRTYFNWEHLNNIKCRLS